MMNFRVFRLLPFAVFAFLASCKDKDYPQAVPPITQLAVVNATADTINFYINGTRQNNLSPIYAGGSPGYLGVISGAQNYQFKKAGSPLVLFSMPLSLNAATYYSLFVGGEAAGKTFLTVDMLDTANTVLRRDTTGTAAMVRFINASPGAAPLDITEDKGDTVNLKSCGFAYVSPFIKINGGLNKKIKIFPSGSSIPALDTVLTLQTGHIYTLFTKGMLNTTGNNALSVGVITNL